MPRPALLIAAILVTLAPGALRAAEPEQCMTSDERRAAIASHRAVPLERAMRAAKVHARGELVRAQLCERGKTLVYVLTVLARDGKVTRATVDAATGRLVSGR